MDEEALQIPTIELPQKQDVGSTGHSGNFENDSYGPYANPETQGPWMDSVVPGRVTCSVNAVSAKSYTPVIAVAIVTLVAVLSLVLVVTDPLNVIWHRDGGSSVDGGATAGSAASGRVYVDGSEQKEETGSKPGSDSGNTASGKTPSTDAISSDAGGDRIQQSKSSVMGNLINGGHMAMGEDGYVYYANPVDGTDWDTRSIVRALPDGSGKTTVYTGPSSTKNLYHISVIGDRVVFNQVIENNSTVVTVRTDGGDKIVLDSCDDWSLCQVDDGWVYYLKSGRICRCDLLGRTRSTMASVGSNTHWRVAGVRLFTFSKNGAREIYCSDLNSSNRTTVYTAANGYEIRNAFPIDSSSLLVWEAPSSGEGTRLTKVDAAGSNPKAFWTSGETIERVCTYNQGVVITKVNSGAYSVATIAFDTGEIGIDEVVSRGTQTRYTCFLKDRIYYGNISDDDALECSVWSIALSGHDARQIR
jgi:hypothetical protein